MLDHHDVRRRALHDVCWHGSVRTFAADANTGGEGMTSVHLSAMMGIGLYAYALDWREAVEMRNELMRAAKASDTHQARAMAEDGEASLIISVAGLPSFQIDRK
jgi:hypothetical protein